MSVPVNTSTNSKSLTRIRRKYSFSQLFNHRYWIYIQEFKQSIKFLSKSNSNIIKCCIKKYEKGDKDVSLFIASAMTSSGRKLARNVLYSHIHPISSLDRSSFGASSLIKPFKVRLRLATDLNSPDPDHNIRQAVSTSFLCRRVPSSESVYGRLLALPRHYFLKRRTFVVKKNDRYCSE